MPPSLPESAGVVPALRRLRRPAAPPPAATPHCDMCAEPIPAAHEHVLDLASSELACCCTACALLFDSTVTARRRLPRDSYALPGLLISGHEWAALAIPVGLAFLTRHAGTEGTEGKEAAGPQPDRPLIAAYPSPAGIVTSRLESEIWQQLVGAHPELRQLRPDIESLLINRFVEPHRSFIVPLDHAFRLAGLVRQNWSGFSGGARVKQTVAEFCEQLALCSREARLA